MKALILAAGYATRLYPLTKEFPKPLLRVDGRPIIEYVIDKLDAIREIDESIVITNSKFIPEFKKWNKKPRSRKPIRLVDDQTQDNATRLGAIGDMNFAIEKKHIEDDVLVIGGDNLFDSGLREFLDFAKAKKKSPVIGVFDIKEKASAKKYGVIKLDGKNRVTHFQEKPACPVSTLVAMCLYYFPKERLGLIKEYLRSRAHKTDATGFYIDWLRKRVPAYGFIFHGHWYDIGDHHFYNAAKQEFCGA